jgi:tRNA threonylcarbamoyladenosine biosynthesis protein TsaB
MLVAALDTTTRTGSFAVLRDRRLLAVRSGDGTRPQVERLPGDLLRLLSEQGVSLPDVDLFAVATGPGSFTGLRLGLAAIQGLAFASGKKVVGVSVFDAMAASVWADGPDPGTDPVAVWLDAQRGEVFAAVLRPSGPRNTEGPWSFGYLDDPSVGTPSAVLDRWEQADWWGRAAFAGDGVPIYRDLLSARIGPGTRIVSPTPLLAPAIGWIAEQRAAAGLALAPHAVKPVYVRRSDVELARDRQRAGSA